MYRCEVCGSLSRPRTPCVRVVLETRRKLYAIRSKANRGYRHAYVTRKRHDGTKYVDRVRRRSRDRKDKIADSGGEGFETVREMIACPTCAAVLKREHDAD